MPVVIAPLLVGLMAIVSVFVLIVLQQTTNIWLRPIVKITTANHHNFFVKVLTAPVKLVAKGIIAVEHAVTASISHALGAQLRPVVKWLNALATVVGETALHIGGLANATYDALNILRHTTIPKLIKAAVDPIKTIAVRADNLSKATDKTLDGITADLGKVLETAGIGVYATLHNQLIGWAKAYDSLHDHVFRSIAPDILAIKQFLYNEIPARISALEAYVTGALSLEIARLGNSVKGIEAVLSSLAAPITDLPGTIPVPIPGVPDIPVDTVLDKLKQLANPAVFAAAAVAAITAAVPHLFCRNTTNVAKKLCGMDESLIDQLLAGTLLAAVVLDMEEIIQLGEQAVGALEGIISEMGDI